MQSQVHFDEIQSHIIHEIKKATKSIHIAVAWFTDQVIFEELCKKARGGVRIELIIFNDQINQKSSINYEQLNDLGGLFLAVGEKKRNATVMHNKFCVIDATTVLNGSYNWSRKAKSNDENITIISECPELAKQFIDEFEAILDRNSGHGKGLVEHTKIMHRVEALRHILVLEDKDDIAQQVIKLKKLLPKKSSEYFEIKEIITVISSGDFELAIKQIDEYTRQRKQIAIFTDPDLPELRLELKAVEIQMSSLENEKADIHKLLFSFQYRHACELGILIREILRIRKALLKVAAEKDNSMKDEYEEAKRDSDGYEEDYQETIDKEVFKLNSAEQQELKSLFRACQKMCHPDVVAAEHHDEATLLCSQLNEAHKINDFKKIKEIFENLNMGIFKPISDTTGDVQKLLKEVVKHRTKVKELSKEIFTLRTSESYLKIKNIADWDAYFTDLRQQLQAELENLEEEMQYL